MTTDVGQVLAIIGAGILLSGAACIINETVREWLIIYRLRRVGIQQTGSIVELKLDVSGKAARHFISFTFKKDGHAKSIHIDQQVNAKHYREFKHGQKIQIRYLPNCPNIARLAAEDADDSIARTILIISALSTMVFPPLILVILISLAYHIQSRTCYK